MQLRPTTDRVRRIQDETAPSYDRRISFFERLLFGGGRRWVCEQARGDVLEIAAGTGRNLPFYRSEMRLTTIELSAEMLAIAHRRQRELGREGELKLGDAQELEFANRSFDTVVCTLGLCTIPDDRRAIAEAFRVLRPGGALLLMEHVRSPSLPVRAVQRALDPLAVHFEADHLLRDPLDHLEGLGFSVETVLRSKLGIVERVAARKPTGAA